MTHPALREWFLAAQRRWPSIPWGFDRFSVHVGSGDPRYPEDLFLGGAASERAPEAWTQIQAEIRPEVLRRIGRIGRKAESAEDLWQEAVLGLMDEDPEATEAPDGRRPGKIRRFRGLAPLAAFMAVRAKRIGIDRIRHLQVQRRAPGEDASREPGRGPSPQEAAQQMEQATRFARQFEQAFASLTPTRQALLGLVFGQQMPKAQAGTLLGLRDYQVSRELSASMECLRLSLESVGPGEWSTAAVDSWMLVWTTLHGQPQEETDE